jgi:nucleoside-diphosphate kinase
MEQTLVVLKPDAIQRGLVGEIMGRFEKAGIKIVGARMFVPSQELLDRHYPSDRKEFVEMLGQRTVESYREQGIDPVEKFGHEDLGKIGENVRTWLTDFMKSGPVFAFVLESPHAIEIVRKMVGNTLPQKSQPGTIRGDFSFDSSFLANSAARPIKNLIHASGNAEEAAMEIPLWFSEDEIFEYDTIHQKFMK